MTDNLAQIAKFHAQLAAEGERRRIAEASLSALTRRTTVHGFLTLYHRLCAIQLSFDEECPRNTRSGVTSPRDRVTPTIIAPWHDFGDLQSETYQ